jgi:hypothetical protein
VFCEFEASGVEKLLQFCFKGVTFGSLAFYYVVMLLDCCFVVASASFSLVAP